MSRALFSSNTVSNENVIQKMNYFISESNYALEFYQADNDYMIKLVRELRDELKKEDSMNNLRWTTEYYADHELFESHYKPAVREVIISIKGILNTDKAYKFLFDVKKHMQKYIAEN